MLLVVMGLAQKRLMLIILVLGADWEHSLVTNRERVVKLS